MFSKFDHERQAHIAQSDNSNVHIHLPAKEGRTISDSQHDKLITEFRRRPAGLLFGGQKFDDRDDKIMRVEVYPEKQGKYLKKGDSNTPKGNPGQKWKNFLCSRIAIKKHGNS